MTVYVDPIFHWPIKNVVTKRYGHYWCHMVADSVEELNTFAKKIGLSISYLQKPSCNTRRWHYDLVPGLRERALMAGAREITPFQYARFLEKRLVLPWDEFIKECDLKLIHCVASDEYKVTATLEKDGKQDVYTVIPDQEGMPMSLPAFLKELQSYMNTGRYESYEKLLRDSPGIADVYYDCDFDELRDIYNFFHEMYLRAKEFFGWKMMELFLFAGKEQE